MITVRGRTVLGPDRDLGSTSALAAKSATSIKLNVSGAAFDAGTNDATDSGSYAVYSNVAFSLWIQN